MATGLVQARILAFEGLKERQDSPNLSSVNLQEAKAHSPGVKKLAQFFEEEKQSDVVETTEIMIDEWKSFVTAREYFEEDIETNVTTETEICPNVSPSEPEKRENPFVFHINAPAANISPAQTDDRRAGTTRRKVSLGTWLYRAARTAMKTHARSASASPHASTPPPQREVRRFASRRSKRTLRLSKTVSKATLKITSFLDQYIARIKHWDSDKSESTPTSGVECGVVCVTPTSPTTLTPSSLESTGAPPQTSAHPKTISVPVEMDVSLPGDNVKTVTVAVKDIRLTVSVEASMEDSDEVSQ